MPDADFIVNGHTHDAWTVPIKRARLSNMGTPSTDLLKFIRTPGYKDDFGDGAEGFHNEKWGAPKPQGCIWIRFYLKNGMIEDELVEDIH